MFRCGYQVALFSSNRLEIGSRERIGPAQGETLLTDKFQCGMSLLDIIKALMRHPCYMRISRYKYLLSIIFNKDNCWVGG